MPRSLLPLFALLATTASGCLLPFEPTPHGGDGTITIDNASSWVLVEVRVAPVDQVSWGPNLLPDVLYPDERLSVRVACDRYDVLISDERRRECILSGVDLCFADSLWTIDNSTLRYCGY